jgi:hypothetical protein
MPQICTKPGILDCPGCLAHCTFKICASYDPVPGTNQIKNLQVTFEGSTQPDPPFIIEEPVELEFPVTDCCWNFNRGRGFVEYTDLNGVSWRLDEAAYGKEVARVAAARTAQQQRVVDRILAKGRCTNWTARDIADYTLFALPARGGGWDIIWSCQPCEPGPTGMSVTRLVQVGGGEIRSFKVDLTIGVTCSCGEAGSSAVLHAQLSGP